jgi:hypothetical protein
MPLVTERWPSREEVEAEGGTFAQHMLLYLIVAEFCHEEEWFDELEGVAARLATSPDGIMYLLDFAQIFYARLAVYNWQVYRIVRPLIHF